VTTTGAADLKFLNRLPHTRIRNFKSISGTGIEISSDALLLPKFV
jgi:hypothetical protein